jgi:glycerol kinase
LGELRKQWGVDHVWKSHMESSTRERLYAEWKKAVTRSFGWVEERGFKAGA